MLCPGGCTINTDQPFTISHFQNSSVATTVVSQVELKCCMHTRQFLKN